MKIIKNFFTEQLIEKISNYCESQKGSPVWYTNSGWISQIKKYSGQVSILDISKIFSEEIKKQFVNYDQSFSEFEFLTLYYEWNNGSYIPFHDDSNHNIGATLYLNKNWDVEDGGIFMYYENNDKENLKCISPKYNNLIINDKNELHHVSLVNYHSKKIRKTIQIWINKKKFSYN